VVIHFPYRTISGILGSLESHWTCNARSVSEVLRQAKSLLCRMVLRSTFDRAVRRKSLALAAGAGNYGISIVEMKQKLMLGLPSLGKEP
jgi:hypothetical protein